MKEFRIQQEPRGNIQVLKLSGSLDLHYFPTLEKHLQAVFQEGCYRVVLDCREIDYVSSAGLGAFVGFAKQAREHGGDVKLLNVSPHIYKIIELLGFTKVLETHERLETAIASFAKS